MYQAQAPSKKIIRGKAIIKAIEETIDTHGYPFFFNYNFGLCLSIQTDCMERNDYGGLVFRSNNLSVFDLTLGYLVLIPTERPDNYCGDLKACFIIRQERTKEILGWLCWE